VGTDWKAASKGCSTIIVYGKKPDVLLQVMLKGLLTVWFFMTPFLDLCSDGAQLVRHVRNLLS
jgi:hypothetical protein